MPQESIDEIESSDDQFIAARIEALHQQVFPEEDRSFIRRHMQYLVGMFRGAHPDYQKMDTRYHDLEHTLQATFCWVRLILNRHKAGVEPVMTAEDFETGYVAILFHDVGYLKEVGDHQGTGAKYTFVHEIRSAEMVDEYLETINWPKSRIVEVRHLISCTGPRSVIDAVPFRSRLERIIGEAVCTADYIGQMSDPGYIDKLPVLFEEFEESDDYRGVPREQRLFKNCDELIRGTPGFWQNVILNKLEADCHGLYRYLAEPYPEGPNPYLASIERNIDRVKSK
ncbi:MAG: hypothetical protein ACLFU4_03970 [Opitutales bacterium]